jgi:hypothetical protein
MIAACAVLACATTFLTLRGAQRGAAAEAA